MPDKILKPSKENPLVSTIIPVHNRPKLILDAVQSVLDQTYRPIEIIVVDDGSTDDTPAVLKNLAHSHPEIVLLHQANAGPGAARERGRKAVNGSLIQYLDSDDLLLPDKFSLQVLALLENADADIAYGKSSVRIIGNREPEDPSPMRKTGQNITKLYPELLISSWWPTSSPLYRKSLLDRVGPWSNLINEEDWEYDARAAALGATLVYCPEFVSVTRYHQDGHLHTGGNVEPIKLRARAQARELMFEHAVRGGQAQNTEEFKHFSKSLFLTARVCGAAGLSIEANSLIQTARQAYSYTDLSSLKLSFYQACACLIGHRWCSRLSQKIIGA